MNNIIKITDLNIPELDIYARLTESQLLHYYEPNGGLFIAESPKVVIRALGAGCEPVSVLVEDKDIEGEAMEALAKCGDIPVYTAPFQDRLQADQRNALCHEETGTSFHERDMPGCQKNSYSGKCHEPYQCRSDFPVGSSTEYGWDHTDKGLQ